MLQLDKYDHDFIATKNIKQRKDKTLYLMLGRQTVFIYFAEKAQRRILSVGRKAGEMNIRFLVRLYYTIIFLFL